MYKISRKLIPEKISDEKRREISGAIKAYRSPDSVIAYLLALLERNLLPTDDNKIHTAISELKKDHSEFFEDFTFSQGGIYPFSKELEEVLFRFQQSGILGVMNPTLEFFIFPKNSKDRVLEHLSNKFSSQERETLSAMSIKLQSLLST